MNTHLRRLALGLSLAAILQPVQAALTVNTTRIVFDSDKRSTSVVIANPSPRPYAVQSWVNTAKDDTDSGHYGMRHSTEAPYVPPKPLKPKADWRSWLGVALGAVFAVVSFMILPPVGLTMAFALGAASLAVDVAATAVSVGALVTGSMAANDWAFWLGIASALSTLGIMGYSRLGAKGAGKATSVGTQTTTDTASIGVGSRKSSSVGSSITRAVKRRGSTISARPSKMAKLDNLGDTPSGFKPHNTVELEWDVIPPGKKGVQRNNSFIDDTPSPEVPGPSRNMTEPPAAIAQDSSPKSPTINWIGSAIGAQREGTLRWPGTGINQYAPPKLTPWSFTS